MPEKAIVYIVNTQFTHIHIAKLQTRIYAFIIIAQFENLLPTRVKNIKTNFLNLNFLSFMGPVTKDENLKEKE